MSDAPRIIDIPSDPAPPSSSSAMPPLTVVPPSSPPPAAPHPGISDPSMFLELVGRALAPEADELTRRAARDLWSQFAPLVAAAPAPAPAPAPIAPVPMPYPPVPSPLGVPLGPLPPPPVPNTQIAMVTQALRQMSPDQLLELVLQRVRAALPTGTTVTTPRGIQFQLIPVPPSPAPR